MQIAERAISYAIIRPSVRLSVTLVDQSKTVEVMIMQLSPRSSPVNLVSSWLTSPRNFLFLDNLLLFHRRSSWKS